MPANHSITNTLFPYLSLFQLYSDGTVVQFRNLDLLPGTKCHGQLRVFSVPSQPRNGHWDIQRCLYSRTIESVGAAREWLA